MKENDRACQNQVNNFLGVIQIFYSVEKIWERLDEICRRSVDERVLENQNGL